MQEISPGAVNSAGTKNCDLLSTRCGEHWRVVLRPSRYSCPPTSCSKLHVPHSWSPAAVEDECVSAIAFLSVPTACTIHQIYCTSHAERCFSSTRISSCRNVQPSMISRSSHLKTRITALDVLLVSLGVWSQAFGDSHKSRSNRTTSRLPDV